MLSNFVELKPTCQRLSVPDLDLARQQIKVGFQQLQYPKNPLKTVYGMVMYIGFDICHPLHLQAGDKIRFFIEKQNPRIWQIKKALDDQGYTLLNSHRNKANSRYLKCQITWQFFDPLPSERQLHPVSHEFFEDCVLIKLAE